jgi:hypothetical protein
LTFAILISGAILMSAILISTIPIVTAICYSCRSQSAANAASLPIETPA